MAIIQTLFLLFFIGSVAGWILEVFFRRFISSANPDRKWINPGFCMGPYLPLYGFGLCILFLLSQWEHRLGSGTIWSRAVMFLFMAVSMTGIEFLAGIGSLKLAKVRLWDYTDEWGNFMGIICPKFSAIWGMIGIAYYYLLHPYMLIAGAWLQNHASFLFVLGMFYGVFLVDVASSAQIVAKLKRYAEENQVIVRYEAIKAGIRRKHEQNREKYHFFFPFHTRLPLAEHLKELENTFEKIKNLKRK